MLDTCWLAGAGWPVKPFIYMTEMGTQQAFADRLGLAIATVVRYEHNRAPRGKALARLENVASTNGFDEYAAVFRKALDDEFAVPTPTPSGQPIQIRSQDETDLVQGLLDVIRQERYAKEAKSVKKLLAPVIAARRREAENHEAIQMQGAAIVRLLESGRSIDDVVRVFRTDIEIIGEAFFRNAGPALIDKRMRDVVAALLKDGWTIRRMADEFGHGESQGYINCAHDLGAHKAIREHERSLEEEKDGERQ